jgi:hypothetical protein
MSSDTKLIMEKEQEPTLYAIAGPSTQQEVA